MKDNILNYLKQLLKNMPTDWLELTTHRLDIYDEARAKRQFLEEFEKLYEQNDSSTAALEGLPTAYDYIRLGHPLSSVLEWAIAKMTGLKADNVISFSSRSMAVLAVLRKNLFLGKKTRILYTHSLPAFYDPEILEEVYGYDLELQKIENFEEISEFDGSTLALSEAKDLDSLANLPKIDFLVHLLPGLGSIILVQGAENEKYISEIQHVRRRESIAMTPANTHLVLQRLTGVTSAKENTAFEGAKKKVLTSIKEITATDSDALLASSGLSMQYAIMMGLVDEALSTHKGKPIKFIVPPNCYGGTNDQARRVAAAIEQVEIIDLLVDGDNEMVQSIDSILEQVAQEDAVPYIIAEIPTNPRVEVPNLQQLQKALGKSRTTKEGKAAIEPVFILDQTFCPNVQFLKEDGIFSGIRAISYVSGSKFPSGGRCTAGYCVANKKAEPLLKKVRKHLQFCDNEATTQQVEILAEQLPTMNRRIEAAYRNTREFVDFIKEKLPTAKINFVSEALAQQGFTPSVFSLDLPTKGSTPQEREDHKRELNQKLIEMMITRIPQESKYCVSYGQLKGCYWTIPATSTQGTTREADKDYIARVSVSPNLNLELHKKVFSDFVSEI